MRTSGKMDKDDRLLSHSILLMAASQVGNVSNLLYHMILGRIWDAHEMPNQYRYFAAMLAIGLIVGTPIDTIRNSVAYFSALAKRDGNEGAVRGIVAYSSRRLFPVALVVVCVCGFFPGQIAGFFHLSPKELIWAESLVIVAMLYMPVVAGALQGTQAFWWMSLCSQGWTLVRLVVGVGLVLAGAGALAAISAHALGMWISVSVAGMGLFGLLKGHPVLSQETPPVFTYFMKAFWPLACYAFLMNADILIVMHYFGEGSTHGFAKAGTIARSVVFLPMPIAWAMFPKVVAKYGSSRSILLKALGMVVFLSGGMAVAGAVFPALPLVILFGSAPEATVPLVRWIVLAMCPLCLVYLGVNYELARHRFRIVVPLAIAVASYVGGVFLFHDSLFQVIGVMAAVNGFAAVSSVVFIFRGGADAHGADGLQANPAKSPAP